MFEVYDAKELDIETNTDVENLTIPNHDYSEVMEAKTADDLSMQLCRHNNFNEQGTAMIISKIVSLFALRTGKNQKNGVYVEYELTSDQVKLINLLEKVFSWKICGRPMVQQLKLLSMQPHLLLSMSYMILRSKRVNSTSIQGNFISWLNCLIDAYMLRCLLDDRLKQWVSLIVRQIKYELDRAMTMSEIEGQFEEIEKRGEAICQSRQNDEIRRVAYRL